MIHPHLVHSDEQIVDTMIELTCLSKSHRVIVAGSDAFDVYLGLYERGFSRVATTTTCRIPCGQHDVALIAGQHSIQALEALVSRIMLFLNTRAIAAVWIASDENQAGKKLRSLLEQAGFRIEAGAKCADGFVLSARRAEWSHVANAA